ncbi:5-(carboxyamino)imidazole ribonucleotide synthase [Alkalibacillus aidingensis]|uniref:5-(carboxyamino)imidazole ribonucleotide synthase n=1 Tax=Alkalibacillus aidingensis TaxID=2747607 RepID=UPI0016614444|nr:5-(carboxyamino)imidazole ribonucleotide synthase [Alkalibacillus aidingensis]
MVNSIQPGKTIGVIGGGQLGRMMAIAAKQMGFRVVVLDPKDHSPTGQVADLEIVSAYDDFEAAKHLKEEADVITYEFENVDSETLKWLEEHAYVPQGSKLIQTTQDRAYEKQAIERSGANVVGYELISSMEELKSGLLKIGYPAVIKTRRFGYDGKGQMKLESEADLKDAEPILAKGPCILEQFIAFDKEISVMVARSVSGEAMTYPVSENIHKNHILHQSIVPARINEKTESKAKKLALQIAESLKLVGVLGVEMFLTASGEIYINEVAPRPHNSGHYTLDACETSQFEQHIRAVCDWKLGEANLYTPVVMTNILGQHVDKVYSDIPGDLKAKLHLYGKDQAKPNRKMGHINFIGDNIEDLLEHIKQLSIWRVQHD